MTELEQYFGGILDGKIVACDKMKRISDILIERYFNPGEFHYDHAIANRHVKFIETFCRLPSGRLGAPFKLELFQKARLQALFGFVDDNDLRQYNECLIAEGRKNGKALALDTDIPTMNGFVKMGEIGVGDYVFGDDGKPHVVTCISDVFENHDCYRVVFRGGYSVVADAAHIWRVKNKKGKIVNKATSELLHFKRPRKDSKGTEYLYRVPVTSAVEYPEQELPIDPYTFGIWLGDGASRDPRITVAYSDLEETRRNIEVQGHTTKVYFPKDRAPVIGIDVIGKGIPNPMLNGLRSLGVIGNKHIPDVYMFSSIAQRYELLKGLMDTDGYCAKSNGQCEFCQKSERIVDQFRELLSSLGIVSSKRHKTIMCNGKECYAYSVLFFVDKKHSCFRLKRKHDNLKESLNDRMLWNSIVDIERVDSVPCKCIAIDSTSHLYLATKNYIVTHNTSETGGVELDMLANDKEGAPQIYNLATKREQAALGFNAAVKMVRMSPVLAANIKKRANDLYMAANFGYIKALASETSSLDGLDVHCAVIDELAAIKNRDLYDLIKQAMGARKQPLLFTITTNGFVRGGIFDSQYAYAANVLNKKIDAPRFLPFIYELDSPAEWDKEECWIKANPGLDTIKSRDYLRQMVQKAKDDPSFKATVMVKDFNVSQTSESAWLRYEDLNNELTFSDMGVAPYRYCVGGFDAADRVDLQAAVALCRRDGDPRIYVKRMFWMPQSIIDEMDRVGARQEKDNAPYRLWISQGFMRTCPGNKCDRRSILDWFCELRDKEDLWVVKIGYDPWHVSDEELRMFRMEFGENSMIPIRQGVATLSEPMKCLAADFKAHNVIYDNDPILKWNLINTSVKSDVNGNIQPCKNMSAQNRIDGVAALLDAYVVSRDYYDQYAYIS